MFAFWFDRNTVRSVLGLDGKLFDSANFEVSYVYGQTDVRNHVLNNRFNDRFSAAVSSWECTGAASRSESTRSVGLSRPQDGVEASGFEGKTRRCSCLGPLIPRHERPRER